MCYVDFAGCTLHGFFVIWQNLDTENSWPFKNFMTGVDWKHFLFPASCWKLFKNFTGLVCCFHLLAGEADELSPKTVNVICYIGFSGSTNHVRFFYLAELDSAVNYIAHLLADGADEFWFSLRTTIVGLGTRKDLRKDVVMIAASARPRFYTSTHPIRWLWLTSLCFHWDGSADVSLPLLGLTVGCDDLHFNGLGCPQKVWKWSEKK